MAPRCPFHPPASQDYLAFTAAVARMLSAFLTASLQERPWLCGLLRKAPCPG